MYRSELGGAVMNAAQRYAQGGNKTSTGWTAPGPTYDKMDQIQASALALSIDIEAHVRRQAFKDSWKAWHEVWKKFYADHIGFISKLASTIATDELAARVESYRVQLENWYGAYGREVDEKGNPLPPTTVRPPQQRMPDEDDKSGLSIPWWGWMLGGVVLVGVGYSVYRTFTKTKRQMEAQEHILRTQLLPAMLPGPLGQAAAAHDMGVPPYLGHG